MAVTYTAGRKPTEGGIWIAIVGNKATFFIERGGIKITLYLGWSWVEWVWRGYIFGYKTPILT